MQFEVAGTIKGKARPRVVHRNGRTMAYTPKETSEFEERVREAYIAAGGEKIEGPVAVSAQTFRALPKSRSKKLESEPDTFKPDGDNILKCVLDALNGVAFDDDSQVVMLSCIKYPRMRRDEYMTVTVCPVKQKETYAKRGKPGEAGVNRGKISK